MADVTYIISLRDRMTSVLRKVSGSVANLNRQVHGLSDSFDTLGSVANLNRQVHGLSDSFDTLGTVVAGAAIVGIFKMGAELEKTQVLFNTLTGSVEKGTKLFTDLEQFANVTPFQNAGLERNAQTLLAFGRETEKIIPTLRMLGDVASGDQNRLNSLALVFGQARSAGKLMGQDLLQFINVGFNPLQEIFRTTGESVSSLKEKMSKGLISFDMVENAFKTATSRGGRFHNLTEKISKTMAGKWSTVMGKAKNMVARLGLSMKGIFVPIIDGMIKAIDFLSKYKNSLFPVIQTLVIFAGVLVGIIAVLKVWIVVQKILNVVLMANPVGLIIVGIAALIAIVVLAYQKSETFRVVLQRTWAIIKGVAAVIKERLIVAWQRLTVATREIVQLFKTLYAVFFDGTDAVNVISTAFNYLVENVLVHFFNVFDAVVNFFTIFLSVLGKIGKFIRNVFTGDIQLISIAFVELGKTITNIIQKQFVMFMKAMGMIAKSAGELAAGNFLKAFDLLKTGTAQLVLGVLGVDVQDNVDAARKIASDVAAAFGDPGKLDLPGFGGGLGEAIGLSGEAKKLQASGIVSGGKINTFNVNIQQVTGIDTLKTTNVQESGERAGEMVMKAILKELADIKVQ